MRKPPRHLLTYSPHADTAMPSQTCERVPPAHVQSTDLWTCIDLSVGPHDDLPLDPRSWGRAEVGAWVARAGGLPERFPMNGKALCLMSREMFTARVPARGRDLHLDFRRRLARALALRELVGELGRK